MFLRSEIIVLKKKLYSGFVKKTVAFGESLSLLSYVLGESLLD